MTRLQERIKNFNKAFALYEEMKNGYVSNNLNNAYRLGLAQSFEIITELGWKVLKDYLYEQGIAVYTPKEVIKEAFNKEIIQNGQIWIDMIDARNLTSHEYNLDKTDGLLKTISTVFYDELFSFKNMIRGFVCE